MTFIVQGTAGLLLLLIWMLALALVFVCVNRIYYREPLAFTRDLLGGALLILFLFSLYKIL